MLPSVTDSGLALLARGEQRLAESARGFTRAADGAGAPTIDGAGAPTTDGAPPAAEPASDSDLVDAAVGIIYGRTQFETGLRLIEVGRDVDKALVDVLA